jgi:hypothetical protein
MKNENVMWAGQRPVKCAICQRELKQQFVDGVVAQSGFWAIMCAVCHSRFGMGLGIGRGQRYDLTSLRKVDG